MHVAGCHVGDTFVFSVRDDNVRNYSTVQDAVNALLGRVTLDADLVKIREVLVKKKEELDALLAPALRELCVAAGAKGMLTK